MEDVVETRLIDQAPCYKRVGGGGYVERGEGGEEERESKRPTS